MEGWMQLRASYFENVCHSILDEYFYSIGLCNIVVRPTSVRYDNGQQYISIDYWVEDFPDYIVMIGVGFLVYKAGHVEGAEHGIGLWYALSEMGMSIDTGWRFSNESELREVLINVKDNVLPIYVAELLAKPTKLQSLIEKYWNEMQQQYQNDLLKQYRTRANAAFDTGDYGEALRLFSIMEPSEFTEVDHKRMEIARKKIQTS